MQRFFYIIVLFCSYTISWAQPAIGQDPSTKVLLEKLSNQYETYNSMEVVFDLILDLPNQDSETQKGKLVQKGELYLLDLQDQAIYSDGSAVWLHLKDNNEVQINDIAEEDEESFLTPKDMMRIYESDDYEYTTIGEEGIGNNKSTIIEFKPTNPDSEYSKLRLTLNTHLNEMTSMVVFSKDGSKYTLNIKDILSNKKYADQLFTFNPKNFPGIHVEDLRL